VDQQLGHRVGLASLLTGTVLPVQRPPLSSSRAKQPGSCSSETAAFMLFMGNFFDIARCPFTTKQASNSSTDHGGGKRRGEGIQNSRFKSFWHPGRLRVADEIRVICRETPAQEQSRSNHPHPCLAARDALEGIEQPRLQSDAR
jgi:hypothetical protein